MGATASHNYATRRLCIFCRFLPGPRHGNISLTDEQERQIVKVVKWFREQKKPLTRIQVRNFAENVDQELNQPPRFKGHQGASYRKLEYILFFFILILFLILLII